MKYSQSIFLIICSFVLAMQGALICDTNVGPSARRYCILSLPTGITCKPEIDEESQTIICTFPGLSMVQLSNYCLQNTSSDGLSCTVRTAGEGAALIVDIASFVHPIVTIIPCDLFNHMIIGVQEQVAASYIYSSSRGTIIHSV